MRNKLFIIAVFLMSFGVAGTASVYMTNNIEPMLALFYGVFTVIGALIFRQRVITTKQIEVRSFK